MDVRSDRARYPRIFTRVASYMMVAEGTARAYTHLGVSDGFHAVSHHANDPDRLVKLTNIQTWHMQQFAAFVGKWRRRPMATARCWIIRCSCTAQHGQAAATGTMDIRCRPSLRGGNGTLRGGQHVDLPTPTPLANLHLTILEKAGAAQKSFGDSTGTIAGV